MTTNIDLENMAKKYNVPLSFIVYKDELYKLKSILKKSTESSIGASLPKTKGLLQQSKSLYIIINMSNTGHPGTHWVALYYSPSLRIYYDSMAVIPPNEVVDFCDGDVIYNDYIQEDIDGTNCGQLALNFLRLVNNSIILV